MVAWLLKFQTSVPFPCLLAPVGLNTDKKRRGGIGLENDTLVAYPLQYRRTHATLICPTSAVNSRLIMHRSKHSPDLSAPVASEYTYPERKSIGKFFTIKYSVF